MAEGCIGAKDACFLTELAFFVDVLPGRGYPSLLQIAVAAGGQLPECKKYQCCALLAAQKFRLPLIIVSMLVH